MSSTCPTSTLEGSQPVDAVLRPIHSRWVEATRHILEPPMELGADFWTRWAAVRYLADAFSEQLAWERALVGELRPFLEPVAADRLARGGDLLFRLRLEIDRIGRRRGSTAEFAAQAGALLEGLGLWCAEIELAASGLTRADLPPEGAAILTHLEAAS